MNHQPCINIKNYCEYIIIRIIIIIMVNYSDSNRLGENFVLHVHCNTSVNVVEISVNVSIFWLSMLKCGKALIPNT